MHTPYLVILKLDDYILFMCIKEVAADLLVLNKAL